MRGKKNSPVPITLITGFLGAGKTTLVNKMLHEANGLRLAVLVNDFGAINIDAELIDGVAEDVVALKNGCICCSLTGGLLAAVGSVLRRPDLPDAIVIEGSGVSDPLEVARALSDPDLQIHAPLDGIVTVVDTARAAELDEEAASLIERQILAADLVLLNKADLADPEQLAAMENRLAIEAPGVRLVRCANADVPLALLLGLARTNDGKYGKALRFLECSAVADEAFESFVYEQPEPIETEWLYDLLSHLPDRVYRVKGVVYLAERPQMRCILQATGRRASITIDRPWTDERPGNRIVFVAAKGTINASYVETRYRRVPGL
ncbi:GTP-binding protein [Mesorhizobium sp. DCY119]|uniref:CobW family GTP-binding protein n=1 Tax=Mesorhizobium sp. DCY119 TaxID=2108445 RepID=UPI001403D1DD|nr:GTP-binding protein [Mesorhizobium sp. DCY119]